MIDADYRGHVKVLLVNHSNEKFQVTTGDRIAQLILEQIKNPETKLVPTLSQTERGSKGFGSTGTSDKPEHGEQLFFKAKLKVARKYIPAKLLLDCGATSPMSCSGPVLVNRAEPECRISGLAV